MEAILDLVFRLYRAAHDTPLGEFDDLAMSMLEAVVPFCAAVWFTAVLERGIPRLLRAHTYKLMPDALRVFVAPSPQLSRALETAAGAAGRAYRLEVAELRCAGDPSRALALVDGTRLETQLLIADGGEAPSQRANWLSLYRTGAQARFDERDLGLAALVMPHLSQALALNRALHLEEDAAQRRSADGERSVASVDGTLLHCGARLREMILAEYPAWDGVALPPSLLSEAERGRLACLSQGDARVHVRRLGNTLLLNVRQCAPIERLSPRELMVAQLFGAGASYKEIARRVAIAPATVRNVVQNAYRKLGVNNKAQLARLMVGSE